MKQPLRVRPLTLDRPPALNGVRSLVVAVALCAAFVLVIYLAIG